jgi:hypothetical protein
MAEEIPARAININDSSDFDLKNKAPSKPVDASKLWSARITGKLNAHFFQKDGTSREGTDWIVQLTRGSEKVPMIVRTYFVINTTSETKSNTKYLTGLIFERINNLLNSGWDPRSFDLSKTQDMGIFISNP